MKKSRVVIAGGGFAGLSAAMYLDKTLARRSDAEVTLISSENFILFTPMPFRPESEKKVIDLLRSIWRHGESTARINSKQYQEIPHARHGRDRIEQ